LDVIIQAAGVKLVEEAGLSFLILILVLIAVVKYLKTLIDRNNALVDAQLEKSEQQTKALMEIIVKNTEVMERVERKLG